MKDYKWFGWFGFKDALILIFLQLPGAWFLDTLNTSCDSWICNYGFRLVAGIVAVTVGFTSMIFLILWVRKTLR